MTRLFTITPVVDPATGLPDWCVVDHRLVGPEIIGHVDRVFFDDPRIVYRSPHLTNCHEYIRQATHAELNAICEEIGLAVALLEEETARHEDFSRRLCEQMRRLARRGKALLGGASYVGLRPAIMAGAVIAEATDAQAAEQLVATQQGVIAFGVMGLVAGLAIGLVCAVVFAGYRYQDGYRDGRYDEWRDRLAAGRRTTTRIVDGGRS